MLMIVLGVAMTIGWLVCGVIVLNQPVISHISYACVWSIVFVFHIILLYDNINAYVHKRQKNKNDQS